MSVYYTITTFSTRYGFSSSATALSSELRLMRSVVAPIDIPRPTLTSDTQTASDTRMTSMITKTVTSMVKETVTQAAALNASSNSSSSIQPNDHFVAVTIGIAVPLSLLLIAAALFGIWSWRKGKLQPTDNTMENELVAYDYGWLEETRSELSAQSIVFEAGEKTPILEADGNARAELGGASPMIAGLRRSQHGLPYRYHR